MEYRDLYDAQRNITGEKILKGEPIPEGRYYTTVVIIIENDNKELLLQVNKKYDLLSFTGGHPKSGETSLQGIITEIKEELGYDVDPKRIEYLKTYQTEDDFVDLYYLKENINLSKLHLDSEEVGGVNWASKDKISMYINNGQILASHIDFYQDFCIIKKY